jgi:hypothetical protein
MASNTYKSETDELLARIYDAAFAAGYRKRDSEIVRCRDCMFYTICEQTSPMAMQKGENFASFDYCSRSRKKEDKA